VCRSRDEVVPILKKDLIFMKTSKQNIENYNQQPLPIVKNDGNKKVTLVLQEKEHKSIV